MPAVGSARSSQGLECRLVPDSLISSGSFYGALSLRQHRCSLGCWEGQAGSPCALVDFRLSSKILFHRRLRAWVYSHLAVIPISQHQHPL